MYQVQSVAPPLPPLSELINTRNITINVSELSLHFRPQLSVYQGNTSVSVTIDFNFFLLLQ